MEDEDQDEDKGTVKNFECEKFHFAWNSWEKLSLLLSSGEAIDIQKTDESLSSSACGGGKDPNDQYVVVPVSKILRSSAAALQQYCLEIVGGNHSSYDKCQHSKEKRSLRIHIENSICKERCGKILPCGHRCINLCSEECGPCYEVTDYKLPTCEHSVGVVCSQMPSSFVNLKCEAMVELDDPGPCGHIAKVPCYKRDSVTDDELLEQCTVPCPTVKICGHQCQGTCITCNQGRFHVRCVQPCGRALPCGHNCESTCCIMEPNGNFTCPPCPKPCASFCEHSKCSLVCSAPCIPCKKTCPWKCVHVKCNRLCAEPCDRKICLEPCPETLPCGCDCIGYCGEPCPPLCRNCDYDELSSSLLLGKELHELTENERFLRLTNCDHTIEYAACEGILGSTEDENDIKAKTCPYCRALIWSCRPFNHYLHPLRARINDKKLLTFGNPNQIEHIQLRCYYKLAISDQWYGQVNLSFNAFKQYLMNACRNEDGNFKQIPLIQINDIEKLVDIYLKLESHAAELCRFLENPPTRHTIGKISLKNPLGYQMFMDYSEKLFQWISARPPPFQMTEKRDIIRELKRLSHIRLMVEHFETIDGCPSEFSSYAKGIGTLDDPIPYTPRILEEFHQHFLDHYTENHRRNRSFQETKGEAEAKYLTATEEFNDVF